MLFGEAFSKLQTRQADGIRLSRWEKDTEVKIQYPDNYSKMTHPYLYLHTKSGNIPWTVPVNEMFDDGWELVFDSTKIVFKEEYKNDRKDNESLCLVD